MVSIITVNYNQLAFTCELLNSIRRNSYKDVEVFVVDNASYESPISFLSSNYPEVKVIVSPQNLGFAGGNNLAVAQAKGDYLFFINNDAEMTDGCLEKLIALFQQNSKLGIVSPLLCYFNDSPTDNADLIQYAGATLIHPLTGRNRITGEKEIDKRQYCLAIPTGYAHGAAMMVSREVIQKVGPMSNDFFLYYEELDWCARIRRSGFEVFIEPNAKIYHKESVSVGTESPLKTYYINRNRIYFMRRNEKPINLALFSIFLTCIAIPKNTVTFLWKGKFEHLKVFYKAIFWNLKDTFMQNNVSGKASELKPITHI